MSRKQFSKIGNSLTDVTTTAITGIDTLIKEISNPLEEFAQNQSDRRLERVANRDSISKAIRAEAKEDIKDDILDMYLDVKNSIEGRRVKLLNAGFDASTVASMLSESVKELGELAKAL